MKTDTHALDSHVVGWAGFAGALFRTLSVAVGLAVLASSPSPAQDAARGSITGRVLNDATGQYLRNAQVSVRDSSLHTVSEAGGTFTLTGVPAGAVELVVSYLGLDTKIIPVTVAAGQLSRCDVHLTSSDYAGDEVVLGQLVVSSEREGNAKAIMEQWHAPNAKKVIASDAFGKVPENNVGEFLKLMPGVTTDYVEADVRAIRIRGYNPKYTSVLFDGSRVAMAGSSTIGTGRVFEFEQLSLSSIETIEITKMPTADQPSTVAGTVNLRSKSAFDSKGRRMEYSLSLTANSSALEFDETYGWDDGYHYKIRPNYAFEFSDVFLGERLGVIAGISRSDVYSTQRHLWIGGGGNAYVVDSDPSNNATEIPRAVSIQFQDGRRPTVRTEQFIRLDFKFTPELTGWTKIDYNTFDNKSLNRNFQMNVPNNSSDGTVGVVNSPGGPVVPGVEYSLRSQTIHGGNWQMTNSGTARAKWGDTMILHGELEFNKTDISITAHGQFSRARNRYGTLDKGWFDNTAATLPNINWSWTRSSPSSPKNITFSQLSGPDGRDPASYQKFDNNTFTALKRSSEDQIWDGGIDLRYKIDLGDVRTTIGAGLSSTFNSREVRRQDGMQYMLVGADGIANSGDNDLPIDWVETRFKSDWGWGGNANGLPVFDRFALADEYYAHPSYFTANTVQHLQARLRGSWDIEERIDAIYLQPMFTLGRIDLSPGVRLERTSSWGKGVHDIGDAAAKRAVNPADPDVVSSSSEAYMVARYGGRLTADSNYSTTLAYLHGTYRIRDNLQVRASYHDAITRADLPNLIPGVSNVVENTEHRTLSSTNPELRPEQSRNVNLALEYYLEPVGQLTVGFFSSRIKDLQRTLSGIPVTDTWLASEYPGYTLSITENVARAKLSGFEIDYSQQLRFLPGPLKGVGVFANYTRVHFDDWEKFDNGAKHTANAGLSYTQDRFYGQFRVNYTGRRLTSPGVGGWRNFDGERVMCDLNLSYRLSRSATLFINGRNIFDEPIWGYMGREEAWARYARFGSFWEAGVRGTF